MSAKLIALDAGHGMKTSGKRTPDGIHEWELNDKVRDKVVKYLKDYDVKFIFPDNNEGSKDESLISRKSMYVKAGVDAAVSIHHNANNGNWNNATGVETYVDRNYTSKDMKLAKCIQKRLPKYTGLKDRGIKMANFTVINQNTVPAVLVEGGFMDGRNDYKVITSNSGQEAYARAVAEGLIEFLGIKKKATNKTETKKETNTTSSPTKVPSTSPKKTSGNETIKAWQKAAMKDGFEFPKYGADGFWREECDAVAKEAVIKKRTVKNNGKDVAVYKYPNLTKIVQKAVGLSGEEVDGMCGKTTSDAIGKYQKSKGLKVDKCVGISTWKKILKI